MTVATFPGVGDENVWGPKLQAYIDQTVARVSLSRFGAKGDGSDQSAAILNAVSSGENLDWGGAGKVYRMTQPLPVTLGKPVTWYGPGAQLVLDMLDTDHVERFIDVNQAGFDFRLLGLNVDANRDAFVGLYARNASTQYARLILDTMSVQNVYRKDQTFVRGDGMFIEGGYEHIVINDPRISGVTMATGAGVTGVSGVTGITVHSLGKTQSWRQVTIRGGLIENVYSEDTTYQADQDGIRLMSAEDDPTILYPYDSDFEIIGTKWHNCQGRAVKSQTEYGSVVNGRIYRDRVVSAPWGVDIDFQVGGGYIENLYCRYLGNAPQMVVNFSGSVTQAKQVPHGSLRGMKINQSGTVAPSWAVQTAPRNQLQSDTFLQDIEYVGDVWPTNMVRVAAISGGAHNLSAERIVGGATGGGFFQAAGVTGTVQTGKWSLRDIFNRGPATNLVTTPNANFLPEVSCSGDQGFNNASQKAIDGGRSVFAGILRARSIGPVPATEGDGSAKAGVLRPCASTLADAATWTLPPSFLTGVGMLLVSVDGDINGQALFAVSTTAVVQLTTGTTFAVGTTADPGTAGKVTVWTSTTGPKIANHTGVSHTVTAWMFG